MIKVWIHAHTHESELTLKMAAPSIGLPGRQEEHGSPAITRVETPGLERFTHPEE